jgi:hypothetical protein
MRRLELTARGAPKKYWNKLGFPVALRNHMVMTELTVTLVIIAGADGTRENMHVL